jgi:amidohydrolase
VLRAARPTPAPAVLLRADMDGLPVTEETGEPFAAPSGVMHACGHDLHTAALVGAAVLLSRHRAELAGDVVFMFQPGEEGHDGAAAMIAEGVLDAAGPRVSAAYGLHVFSSTLPRGVFATRPGTLMAASAALFVTVRGVGGHASRPHLAADPIVVAAEMLTALQTMVTRQFDLFDPVLITVGLFHAGTRRNVIPGSATFEATVRTFSAEALARVQDRSVRLCTQIAAAHGLQADVSFTGEYPVTVNDPDHADFALEVAAEVFGQDRARSLPDPIMGSEDFSRVLAEVPGAFVFLGACAGDDPATAPTNHSALARFDESVLPDAALLLAELARRRLHRIARRPAEEK